MLLRLWLAVNNHNAARPRRWIYVASVIESYQSNTYYFPHISVNTECPISVIHYAYGYTTLILRVACTIIACFTITWLHFVVCICTFMKTGERAANVQLKFMWLYSLLTSRVEYTTDRYRRDIHLDLCSLAFYVSMLSVSDTTNGMANIFYSQANETNHIPRWTMNETPNSITRNNTCLLRNVIFIFYIFDCCVIVVENT